MPGSSLLLKLWNGFALARFSEEVEYTARMAIERGTRLGALSRKQKLKVVFFMALTIVWGRKKNTRRPLFHGTTVSRQGRFLATLLTAYSRLALVC